MGIRRADKTGWKKFIIKPDFTGFSEISGGFETPFGRVESGYEITDGKIKFFCDIPVNTEVEIILPNKTERVGSGKYFFSELCEMAEQSEISTLIDCGDERFLSPESMKNAVENYCMEHGLQVPKTVGEFSKVIYRSLALCYKNMSNVKRNATNIEKMLQ